MLSLSSFVAPLCVLALTFGLHTTPARAELSCMDEDGNAVDWFIAYKFPKIKGGLEQFETGLAYAYITSDDVGGRLTARSGDLVEPDDDPESEAFLDQFRELLMRVAGTISSRPSLPPKEASGRNRRKKTGKQMVTRDKWIVSQRLVEDPKSAIMRTLAPAYAKGTIINSLFYNDDPSDLEDARTANSRRAHAKGALLMDESSDTGLWLTHSVPKFPSTRAQGLGYPSSGKDNGQTLMCVSFDLQKSGAQLIDHLLNMRPLVYDRKISKTLIQRFPNVDYLDLEGNIRGMKIESVPTLAQTISTRGGQVINLFSKSMTFNQDLWDGYVDREMSTDLYVQSWRRGAGGVISSVCPASTYHVNNVEDLKYDGAIQWSYLKDHSKWAISDEQELGTVCIGDMNRMESQFKRGGGAVCLKSPPLWSAFSSTILDIEPCPRGSRKSKQAKVADRSIMTRISDALHL